MTTLTCFLIRQHRAPGSRSLALPFLPVFDGILCSGLLKPLINLWSRLPTARSIFGLWSSFDRGTVHLATVPTAMSLVHTTPLALVKFSLSPFSLFQTFILFSPAVVPECSKTFPVRNFLFLHVVFLSYLVIVIGYLYILWDSFSKSNNPNSFHERLVFAHFDCYHAIWKFFQAAGRACSFRPQKFQGHSSTRRSRPGQNRFLWALRSYGRLQPFHPIFRVSCVVPWDPATRSHCPWGVPHQASELREAASLFKACWSQRTYSGLTPSLFQKGWVFPFSLLIFMSHSCLQPLLVLPTFVPRRWKELLRYVFLFILFSFRY